MSSLIFSDEETGNHRTARFIFVPWLVRLLSDGPVRGEGEPLPENCPEALTDETVEAVKVIVSQTCWQFLARECGWKRRYAVQAGERSDHKAKRVWDNRDAVPHLTFSESTVDFLITIFNSTRNGGDLSSASIPDMSQANGDLLIQHLVFRRISEAPKSFGLPDTEVVLPWLQNPLNAMYDPLGYCHTESPGSDWKRLCDDDLAAFVPWIGLHHVGNWIARGDEFSAGELVDWLSWMEALTFLVTDLGLQLEKSKRLGLATFFLDLMLLHESRGKTRYTQFTALTSDIPLKERRELAQSWVDFLSFINPLEESARKAISIHPIERTAEQRCYLAHWESLRFSDTVSKIRDLSQQLRPSIN